MVKEAVYLLQQSAPKASPDVGNVHGSSFEADNKLNFILWFFFRFFFFLFRTKSNHMSSVLLLQTCIYLANILTDFQNTMLQYGLVGHYRFKYFNALFISYLPQASCLEL